MTNTTLPPAPPPRAIHLLGLDDDELAARAVEADSVARDIRRNDIPYDFRNYSPRISPQSARIRDIHYGQVAAEMGVALDVAEVQQFLTGESELLNRVIDTLAYASQVNQQLLMGEVAGPKFRANLAVARGRVAQTPATADGLSSRAGGWDQLEPTQRAAGLHLYAYALHRSGDREFALNRIEAAIEAYEALGDAGTLGKAYAEVERFSLLDDPTAADHMRVDEAIKAMDSFATTAGLTTPVGAAVMRDVVQSRGCVRDHSRALTTQQSLA
jgi:hypothetical protein